ncbi:sigma-54 interaction domain-containing protein [Lacipirellula parvula]|uniref:Response regulator of zinc sigma-54-dependent two-component system n=1 Tax=Lacipirellula parvula TaxID=2650471 RepID=A0A5K7XCZ8_9BACT|nr:sigma-54 dependent transcriptional regulator [Lacipirellula parvula]BBO33877.1 response regulator of zinc sigma-54-dependent two-component system [Lacipirellula parvula]
MNARRLASPPHTSGLVGSSAATCRLRAEIARAAPFASNVLITGPSGAGKELVAREVHALSARAGGPFVPVDCASLVGELMASQLFGHVAGAFTGANCDAVGCFQAANGGTLFLDEIGEMELPLQAKLLRVVQERVVTPVGSYAGRPIDVRIVAATNRNLLREVREGRFREDLYYRLHVVHLQASALRDRPDDIPALAATFLQQLAGEGLPCCTLSLEAIAALMAYAWPGNVRQLRNVLEQSVIEAAEPTITGRSIERLLEEEQYYDEPLTDESAKELAAALPSPPLLPPLPASPAWMTLAELEREHLVRTLELTYFNRAAAARLLGISRQALLRKIERHGLA